MNVASLCHQKTGTTLEIEEVTLRRLVWEHAGETVFGLLHRIGYEWAYSVRWGPKDPEFDYADRSLGHLLFSFGQWSANGFRKFKPPRLVASFEVTPEWVREHYPDAGWPWDGSDLEDCEGSSQ